MIVSISTANLYFVPFEKTLEIYKKAGYAYIELAGYWKGGEWEIAQRLKNYRPKEVVALVEKSGLKISTFHDMGGVIEVGAESIVSENTLEYMRYYDFPCLIFHTPHKKNENAAWWSEYRAKAIADLHNIRGDRLVCMENLFAVENYYMPWVNPNEMLDFLNEADVYLNLDTTHCAHSKTDIADAANTLGSRIKTIHLSDYKDGVQHVHPGEGTLDFASFFKAIRRDEVHSICLECAIAYDANDNSVAVNSARKAREFVEKLI